MSGLWLGLVASGVVLAVYAALSASIIRRLVSTQAAGTNPLGWATAAIFLSFAVHHGLHVVHGIGPALDGDTALGTAYSGWLVITWDVLSAVVAIWYLTLRSRFPALAGGSLFDDAKARQQQALDIHDSIVQGLAIAKMSIELNRTDEGLVAVQQTLAASRRIITDLLGEATLDTALRPGDLRREEALGGRQS